MLCSQFGNEKSERKRRPYVRDVVRASIVEKGKYLHEINVGPAACP